MDKIFKNKDKTKDWIQNYQPVFKSSQMKPCIQLKRKIFRRSGFIQSETETSIMGSDVFFTSTVE